MDKCTNDFGGQFFILCVVLDAVLSKYLRGEPRPGCKRCAFAALSTSTTEISSSLQSSSSPPKKARLPKYVVQRLDAENAAELERIMASNESNSDVSTLNLKSCFIEINTATITEKHTAA